MLRKVLGPSYDLRNVCLFHSNGGAEASPLFVHTSAGGRASKCSLISAEIAIPNLSSCPTEEQSQSMTPTQESKLIWNDYILCNDCVMNVMHF